ncbi:hypothetical protein ES703_89119 [subsurface metagenome]
MPKAKDVTATQIGAIGENLVAIRLMLESKGRLSPCKPVADDAGIDFLVYDKKTGSAVALQIKTRTKTIKRYPKLVQFVVRKATLKKVQNTFIVAVLFDLTIGELNVRRAWLIPISEFLRVAMKRTEYYVIHPSIDLRSQDKYLPYRCKNLGELTKRLINHIDRIK